MPPLARRRALGTAVLATLLAASAGAIPALAHVLLPESGRIARGVRISSVPVRGDASPADAARAAADAVLSRRVSLTFGGEPLIEASAAELGATVDVASLAATLESIGRRGDVWTRIDDARAARRGAVDVAVRVRVPVEPLAALLEPEKEDRDTRPSAARRDFRRGGATLHAPGVLLDVYGAAEAVARALVAGDGPTVVEVPVLEIAPTATTDVVAAVDLSAVLSRFETRFGYVGDQRGRGQNVTLAASRMDGVVLMPGEVVSFNDNVGARSVDNGFAVAPEIYKGEIRPGIGGGTCQVAGTLHAAAYLGGIDVIERANHSRPSGYIRMGLDATVVYPTVDLKLRNPYDFPIVVHATIDRGTLVFELRGSRRPATVRFDTATVGVADYKRRIEEVPALPEGKVVLKQHGIPGYSVRKTRFIQLAGGGSRTEVTTDTYPPTVEIYQVGPGADLEALPPLPDRRTADNDHSPEAPPTRPR